MHAPVAEAAPNAAGPECPGELSYGTRSEYVRYMQHLVNTYMSNPKRGKWTPIEEDGVFGIDTHRGVSIVQQYWNNEHKESIPVDGIVGPKTWKALGAC
jgi:peptidoglycan hydrolase-like protein with peptidoglycan-binding domain